MQSYTNRFVKLERERERENSHMNAHDWIPIGRQYDRTIVDVRAIVLIDYRIKYGPYLIETRLLEGVQVIASAFRITTTI